MFESLAAILTLRTKSTSGVACTGGKLSVSPLLLLLAERAVLVQLSGERHGVVECRQG